MQPLVNPAVRELQQDVAEWHLRKFGRIGSIDVMFDKLVREVKELSDDLWNLDKRGEELADVVIVALGLATLFGADLATELIDKLEKIEQRPVLTREDGSKYLGKGPLD